MWEDLTRLAVSDGRRTTASGARELARPMHNPTRPTYAPDPYTRPIQSTQSLATPHIRGEPTDGGSKMSLHKSLSGAIAVVCLSMTLTGSTPASS